MPLYSDFFWVHKGAVEAQGSPSTSCPSLHTQLIQCKGASGVQSLHWETQDVCTHINIVFLDTHTQITLRLKAERFLKTHLQPTEP